jgi:hypothetical protein
MKPEEYLKHSRLLWEDLKRIRKILHDGAKAKAKGVTRGGNFTDKFIKQQESVLNRVKKLDEKFWK